MGGKLVAVLASVALVCASSGVIEAGPSGGALPPQLTRVLEIAGHHGVPDDAEMVAVNITAVAPADAGHLTVYPCDQDLPTASNLNYGPDDVVPNLALVRIADDGSICIATHAVVDLVVDIVGYVPAGSGITTLDTPDRVVDTRTAGGPIEAGSHRVIDLGEVVGDDSTLAMFNLTSVRAEDHGHATVYPCTADVPNTSSINYVPGRTVANFVIARLSSERTVCVHSLATSHFVVDVVAFADEGIVTMGEPRRILDSRTTATGPVAGGTAVRVDVTGQPGVPDTASSAVYNLTAAAPVAPGHATSYPCDDERPEASNLNYRPGLNAANGAITKLSSNGELCIHVHATTHLVVDLVGYTSDTAHYVSLVPTRALDSRNGWEAECPWVAEPAYGGFEIGWELYVHPIDGSSPLRRSGINLSKGIRPGSSLDCSKLLYMGSGDSTSQFRLMALSTVSDTPAEIVGTSFSSFGWFRAVQQQDDGSHLAVDRSGVVVDAMTGDIVWEHPDDVDVMRAAISRNGLVALRTGSHYETTVRDGSGRIEVWDVDTGEAVSFIEVPDRNIEFDMSPDGTYLAIDMADEPDTGAVTFITTVFGDIVETQPTESRAISRFLGPGVVTQCIDGVGLTRHDLFGPWTPGFLPRIAPEAATYGATPCHTVWP